MARKKAQPDVAKKDYSQSGRRGWLVEGKALPSGAYPIADTEDLHNAAVLARSGHGDVEAARRLIARRAKELGVANPLESSEKAAMGNAFAPGGRDLVRCPGVASADRRASVAFERRSWRRDRPDEHAGSA